MASLSDAFPAPNNDAKVFERTENPQSYDQPYAAVRHIKDARHQLGIVGGNEVSRIAGNQADLESDLFGITRPNTWCATRKHLPPNGTTIERANPKMNLKINAKPVHLPAYQMWALPAVIGPEPLAKETCHRPEKY
jgi:hypothetical protein